MNSIKTKGLVFSFAVIFFAIFTLGFSAYYRFKFILIDEVNNAVVRVAQESADHLNNYINQFVSPLVGLSNDADIQSMDWEKQKEVISAQVNPTYLNVAVVDLNGTAHYVDDSTIDISDRNYVKEALSGKMAFSEVIISRKTGTPVIMVGVPICKNGVIQGALIARLDVDFLQNYAMTRGYGENGRAYIISDEGTFISRPETDEHDQIFNLFDIAAADDRYTSFSEFIKQCDTKTSGYGQYVFEGKHILMGYASVDETDWKIYIGTYEDETLKSLVGLRQMIFTIMAVTLLVSSIAAYIFVNRFSRSIIELDALFEQGAKGNLTIRFTPKSKDEIGRVGISFNRMMDKIKTLTQYDPLTALLNQYVLEKDIETLVHSDEQQDFSLIMIAIDKFGFINEAYGYPTGDAILYEVARRISSCATGTYQVYRYKGDEFVVLSKDNISEGEIYQKAQNILALLQDSYQIGGKIIHINLNLGLFTWNEDTRSEEPLKAVTHAKNYAKYLGSNQIQRFEQHIYKKLLIMNELQADILQGVRENQFFLVYQPLFYLHNENISEIEALIRWNHPEKGLLYPDQFIELAEQAGTIVNIDYWVMEEACKQLRVWMNQKKAPVILSINISAKSFETKSFIPDLIEMIRRFDVDPTLLQLEITERMVIKNVDESIIKLNVLREMGIHVAIDDFGIGYSSLSYIVRLPIDSIKIDKAFVQNIDSSKEAKAIVSSIINLCKTLNYRVIAEGIENSLELEYLRFNQCDIGQGYY
ncbi:MAG TPA: EAL domain-containing protein, partial [Mobilitalea sp.]|nr:EAL domain-containing protein [Mobilitalea sp.]